jgi:hypothetical protein
MVFAWVGVDKRFVRLIFCCFYIQLLYSAFVLDGRSDGLHLFHFNGRRRRLVFSESDLIGLVPNHDVDEKGYQHNNTRHS